MKKVILTGLAIAAIGLYGAFGTSETELITYQKEVVAGDTLWDICSKVASDQDELSELVYRTMQDNGITNPANLQPGTLVIVRVKPIRE